MHDRDSGGFFPGFLVLFQKAWLGILALVGGVTVEDFSHLMAGLSYFAGALWFGLQTYFLWRDKRRDDKED